MAALKSFVAARHEILKCNLRIGINQDVFATLSEKAASAIMEATTKAVLTADYCASILGDVVDGPMLQKDKEAVVAHINLKMDMSSHGQALSMKQKAAMQEWQHIANYFTEAQWTVFNGKMQLSSKIDMCMQHVRRLGLVHPTERTVTVLAAVCLGQASFTMSPKQLLEVVHMIKSVNKSFTLHVGTTPTSVERLPENPQEFKATAQLFWNAAFGDSEPVPNPISELIWAHLLGRIPCRSTRAGASKLSPQQMSKNIPGEIHIEYLQPRVQHSPFHAIADAGSSSVQQYHIHGQEGSRGPSQVKVLALPAPPSPSPTTPATPATTIAASDSQLDEVAPAATKEITPLEKMVEAMKQQMKPHVAADLASDADAAVAPTEVAAKPGGRKGAGMKRPAAAPAQKLGCSKCRWSDNGCKQCRNPFFSGKRQH